MDKLNCSEFCDVLIELGVAHVISFEIKNDENIEEREKYRSIDLNNTKYTKRLNNEIDS